MAGILYGSLDINNFSQHEFHPKPTDENAFNWIFVIDTLNFCFWTGGDKADKWTVDKQTGYFALCAAIKKARKGPVDITDPNIFASITLEELDKILTSDDSATKPPLLAERVACLHEVGAKLLEKYDGEVLTRCFQEIDKNLNIFTGKFENVVKSANGSAKKLLEIIVEDFPCFRDEAFYKDQQVSLYKRAQILIGDIYAFTRGEGLGSFSDLNETITMFADYRVPQVLVHFGALKYKEQLLNDLESDKMLQNGEPKEVEIRGASIYIVEAVKKKALEILTKSHPGVAQKHVNSILIDHWLWDYRRANAESLSYIPFHKTISVYY